MNMYYNGANVWPPFTPKIRALLNSDANALWTQGPTKILTVISHVSLYISKEYTSVWARATGIVGTPNAFTKIHMVSPHRSARSWRIHPTANTRRRRTRVKDTLLWPCQWLDGGDGALIFPTIYRNVELDSTFQKSIIS